MRTTLIIAALLVASHSGAGVYKRIGPDGQIQYTDRRSSDAERVGIHLDRAAEASDNAPAGEISAQLGPYSDFEIVSPEPNQTLRNAEGKLELGLLIDPPLAADHRLQILLDGQPVPGNAEGTQILLQHVTFGSHRIQAHIRDDLGEIVASSPLVGFHLRKPLPDTP